MNEERREYLKPFRCSGGLLLFLGAFSTVFSAASAPLFLAFLPMIGNEKILEEMSVIISAPILVYTYYIGYRIFVRKYHPETVKISPVRKSDLLSALLWIVGGLVVVRVIWYLQVQFLNSLGIDTASEESAGIISLIYAVLIAPVCEEIVFRDYLITLLKRYGTAVAIIISSIGFGLFHGTLLQALPSMAIGVILAMMAIRFDSIIPSIILHVATNAISMFSTGNYEYEVLMPYLLPAAGVILVIFIIFNLGKVKKAPSGLKNALSLYWHSLSLIAFSVFYLGMILFQLYSSTAAG